MRRRRPRPFSARAAFQYQALSPPLSQTKSARDDAAQNLGGAAMDNKIRRDLESEGKLLIERHAVAGIRFEERAQIAHPLGQFLLPDGAEILDDRRLHNRLLA